MKCIAPEEIKEGDLLAYVEGCASQQVKRHVEGCPFCTAEAKALARLEQLLLDGLYRASCPDTGVLLQYQHDLLSALERHQIEEHLQVCPLCVAELDQLAALDAPQFDLREQMRRVVRPVIEAFRVEPPSRMAIALRSGDANMQLYRADHFDILLSSEIVEPASNLWRLRGRITQGGQAVPELNGCAVRFVQAHTPIARQHIDNLGYIAFDDLASGEYDLWFELPETEIVVRGVGVGKRST